MALQNLNAITEHDHDFGARTSALKQVCVIEMLRLPPVVGGLLRGSIW